MVIGDMLLTEQLFRVGDKWKAQHAFPRGSQQPGQSKSHLPEHISHYSSRKLSSKNHEYYTTLHVLQDSEKAVWKGLPDKRCDLLPRDTDSIK